MDKPLTLIFYQEDADAAKQLADEMRKEDENINVNIRDASVLVDIEEAAQVILMPDVTDYAGNVRRFYGDKVEKAKKSAEPRYSAEDDFSKWEIIRHRNKFYVADPEGNLKSTGYRRRSDAEEWFKETTGQEPPG